jgi:hypothetical protein
LSSDLDKYLPLTGGTVNGIIYLNHTLSQGSRISFKNNRTEESSSWAVNIMNATDVSSNVMMRFGIYGTAKVLDYIFLGHNTYTGNNLRVYTDKVTFGSNKIWHAGNDGSGSGLDADLLDGVELNKLTANIFKRGIVDQLTANTDLNELTYENDKLGYYSANDNVKPTNAPTTNFGLLSVSLNTSYTGQLIMGYGNTGRMYYRSQHYGNSTKYWSQWEKIAYVTDNVASATKLQTARKIWGQDFDGTGDVSGALSEVTGITMTGGINQSVGENRFSAGSTYTDPAPNKAASAKFCGLIAQTGGDALLCTTSGNVGMGTTNPLSKCHIVHSNWDNGLILQRAGGGVGAGIKFMDSASMLGIIGINGTKTFEVNLSKDGSTNVNRLTINNTGTMSVNSDNAGVIVIKRIIANGGAFVDYHSNNASVRDWRVGSNSYGNFTFNSFSSNTETERITFTKSGNVGFGAPNPSAKLHVVGGANPIMCESNTSESSIYFVGAGTDSAYKWAVGKGVWGLSGKFGIGEYNTKKALYMQIGIDGNVGIGVPYTANPSAKLHVAGNILATGGITMQSQRSLKNVVDERGLSLTELSEIKPTRYTWKDKRDDRLHFGGIADDIEKVLPEVIYRTSDGTLTMDYGNAGFAVATSLIKPVVDHETKIRMLEIRVKELEEELKRYSA